MEATGLVKYDAMVHAIAECIRVDEVKDVRDKARALELYAQQARNIEAEQRAAGIRIRAERKTGQLLMKTEKATGNQHKKSARSPDSTKQTLADIGISKDQSSKWQKLAEPSDKEFEQALDKASTNGVPTTVGVMHNMGIRTNGSYKPPSDPIAGKALSLWGWVNRFPEEIGSATPAECAGRCDEVLHRDLKKNLGGVIRWLRNLQREL